MKQVWETMHALMEYCYNMGSWHWLNRLFGISWQNRVTNIDVLARAAVSSMFATLTQRRLRWLSHFTKDILDGELAIGTRTTGRLTSLLSGTRCVQTGPQTRGFNSHLESVAFNRLCWRPTTKAVIKTQRRKETSIGRKSDSVSNRGSCRSHQLHRYNL
jgi:hypothetical protein